MFFSFKIKKSLAGLIGGLLVAGIATVILLFSPISPVQALSNPQESVSLPIVMYHGLLKDPKMQGEYVISPDLFESDLKYLKENGYHTVTMADVIAFVQEGKPLPEKPVMLTFDDGYYNNYLYAYPLAQEYQSKIVISPIGYFTDQYSAADSDHATYSHITWDEIREMMDSGYVEFQNHTYNLHTNSGGRIGAQKQKGEDEAEYQAMLREDLSTLQQEMKNNTGYIPTTFVYPFGAVSDAAMPVIREMGFQATLICESRVNTITRDPECLYGLGRYRRPCHVPSQTFFEQKMKLA